VGPPPVVQPEVVPKAEPTMPPAPRKIPQEDWNQTMP
jgi:hypothetical protein